MKNYKTEIKWAFIFIASLIIWMLFERLVGLHGEHIDKHMIYTNFYAIIAIALYVFALREKREKDYDGVMSYKQGFISGVIITVIVTIFSPLTQYIIVTVISPEFFPNAIEYAVGTDSMTRTQAEEYFSLSNYILQSVIGAFVMGLITAAIVALFTKTKKEVESAEA